MNNRQKNDYKILYESLPDRYFRLLFMTGAPEERSFFLHQAPNIGRQIHVSLELATVLQNLPAGQRTKAVIEFFSRLGEDSSAVFLTDLEILFDHSLNVDPVKLLKTAARNRAMVVDWPGEVDFAANALIYAVPGHAEYFSAELTDDLLFFDMSGRNSLNKNS